MMFLVLHRLARAVNTHSAPKDGRVLISLAKLQAHLKGKDGKIKGSRYPVFRAYLPLLPAILAEAFKACCDWSI